MTLLAFVQFFIMFLEKHANTRQGIVAIFKNKVFIICLRWAGRWGAVNSFIKLALTFSKGIMKAEGNLKCTLS